MRPVVVPEDAMAMCTRVGWLRRSDEYPGWLISRWFLAYVGTESESMALASPVDADFAPILRATIAAQVAAARVEAKEDVSFRLPYNHPVTYGSTCSECDGDGVVECECCGHESDCDDCDGDGGVKTITPQQIGQVAYEGGGRVLGVQARLAPLLDGLTVMVGGPGDALAGVDSVGDAVVYVMPLRELEPKPC